MRLERDDGVGLHYDVHPGGDGTPMLLTHGYGASGGMWEQNLPALSAGRTVLTWDMRGHGSSDAPEDASLYTHEACLDDMAALLDAARIERAVLGGMSLGGYLSLRFMVRWPQRVAGLVLVDTGPGFRDPSTRDAWNAWALDRADALETHELAALPQGPEQRQARHIHGTRGLAHAARGMLVQHDSRVFEGLSDVRVPTLIVVGAQDKAFLAAAGAMERRIPMARKIVLEAAGHAANMDAPEQFNAAVSEFLEEL
jgi:pimeloyl-ACP methyl ester carboxylesterase